MMRTVLIAAMALGVAVPGVAAAQGPGGYGGGYAGPGGYYQGDPYRDGNRFYSRRDERHWAKEHRREERERRRAWERAHRHGYDRYGHDRYGY